MSEFRLQRLDHTLTDLTKPVTSVQSSQSSI